jgi:hypothetical protein
MINFSCGKLNPSCPHCRSENVSELNGGRCYKTFSIDDVIKQASCYIDGRQVLFAGRISASMLTAGRVKQDKDPQE